MESATPTYPNEGEVFKPSTTVGMSSDSKKSILDKIKASQKADALVITSLRGKLKDNYFIFIPVKINNTIEYVILFDSGFIFEIEIEVDEEGKEVRTYISLSQEQQQILQINQEEIIVKVDVSIKNVNQRDIEALYHLKQGIFDESLFEALESICNNKEGRFTLKEEYKLTTGGIVNSRLSELYERYCKLLRKFYHNDDVFYPVSFAFYCVEILRDGIGYIFLLILNGLPGSGKSNFLKFMQNLLPLSYASNSASTIKAAIRYIDLFGVSVMFDELDKVGKSDAKKYICGILNNSIDETATFSIARADEKKKGKQFQTFRTFGGKCVAANNLQSIEDSTISRSFLFTSLPNRHCEVYKWETVFRSNSIDEELRDEFRRFAQELFLAVFLNSKEFVNNINIVQKATIGSSREDDKLSLVRGALTPILPEEELNGLVEEIKMYTNVNATEQVHKIVITAVDYLLGESNRQGNYEVIEYRSGNIVDALNAEKDEGEPRYSINSPQIRPKLIEYGLIDSEYKKEGKYNTYCLPTEKLFELIENNLSLNKIFGGDRRIQICRDRREGKLRETGVPYEENLDVGEIDLS